MAQNINGLTVVPLYLGGLGRCSSGMPHAQTPTYAPSHISIAVRGAGTMAAQAERLKMAKYGHLGLSHFFVPFAVETSGVAR